MGVTLGAFTDTTDDKYIKFVHHFVWSSYVHEVLLDY